MSHRRSPFVLLLPLASFAACGDISVRSVSPASAVATAFAGEWTGSWQSTNGRTSGGVTIAVQRFEGEPVVGIVIDNPCLVPGSYELRAVPGGIELLRGGDAVFTAQRVGERQLVGSYGCHEDSGTWEATWQRLLPDPADLSGPWAGLAFVGTLELPMVLTIDQGVENGALSLVGQLRLPSGWPAPVPVAGGVRFFGEQFEALLSTVPGGGPNVELLLFGSAAAGQASPGLLRVLDPGPQPFAQAVVQLQRQPAGP
jgi:hypothetical protein